LRQAKRKYNKKNDRKGKTPILIGPFMF